MSNFTVKEIDTDKVVMVRGEERIEVNVIDPAKPKRGDTGLAPKESKTPTEKTISPASPKRPPMPYRSEKDDGKARR